jgi:uncharacterized protein
MEFKALDNKSRIKVVDALRGFALLGVLIANIPFSEEGLIAGKLDSLMNFLYYLLIDKKFISIFSMLFGFGFYIQMKRAEEKSINFTKYFTVRMLLLFAIGSLHTFIIWNGDIIRAYAFGGILLMFIRKWPLKRLLIMALVFNIFLTGVVFIGNSALGWQIYNYDYALATERVLTTSYFRYLVINAIMDPWVNFLKDMPITLFFTFGNMLIGVILAKINFFQLPQKFKKLTNWLIILGITFGIASSYIFYKISMGEIELDIPLLWVPFVLVTGMLLQSMMYISVFVRLFNRKGYQKILQVFTPVGKTALSNYILQSLLYVFVFFHCTPMFQLFGKLTIAETFLFGFIFFTFQSIISYLWLRKHSQGPLESIWKRFSYQMAKPKNKDEIKKAGKDNYVSNSRSFNTSN